MFLLCLFCVVLCYHLQGEKGLNGLDGTPGEMGAAGEKGDLGELGERGMQVRRCDILEFFLLWMMTMA